MSWRRNAVAIKDIMLAAHGGNYPRRDMAMFRRYGGNPSTGDKKRHAASVECAWRWWRDQTYAPGLGFRSEVSVDVATAMPSIQNGESNWSRLTRARYHQ